MRDHHVTCQEIVEIATEYLEHALDPDTAEQFEEHINFCDGCDAYLVQMRTTIATVGSVEPEAPPVATQQRLLSRFREWKQT